MEAGYDYLLLRRKLQRNLFTFPAIFLVVFGALLLAGGGAYYGYAAKARADLGQLNVTVPKAETFSLDQKPPERSGDADKPVVTEANEIELPPAISASVIAGQSLEPGDSRQPHAWTNPLSYEPADYREQALLQGFTPMGADQALPVGSQAEATRLIVPSIGIDSSVNELAILDFGDSRTYETPVNTVGHIPETASGGEASSSWFFGHLESPIVGEGSVFYNLPQIAEQLRNGQEVSIITDNGVHQYLYRVTATEVVHQDDMHLTESGIATIHLVSCVPRLVYDHRLIVTGELIGVK
ncbi:MAG: sortase [Dehalococcoidia bacterium]